MDMAMRKLVSNNIVDPTDMQNPQINVAPEQNVHYKLHEGDKW